MKNIIIIVLLTISVALVIIVATKGPVDSEPTADNKPPESGPVVIVETNYGPIKIIAYESEAPKTVRNFLTLVGQGYYNGLIFHRVIKDFMIQGGDPFCRPNPAEDSGPCGAGGPGYAFEDELNPAAASYKAGYRRGVVAMANAGPNTNGGQFFILHQDTPLPHNYTIFGRVTDGLEVVDKIAGLAVSDSDRPLEPAIITKTHPQ